MQELTLAYATIVSIIGCIAILIGAWMLFRAPPTAAVRCFMILMILFASSAFWSVAMAISKTEAEAVVMARMVTFSYTLMFGCFYEMAYYLLPEDVREPITWKRQVFRFEIVIMALLSGALVSSVRVVSTGYVVGTDLGTIIGISGSLILVVGTVQKLSFYTKVMRTFRRQALLISLGMLSPFIFGFTLYGIALCLGMSIPIPLSIGYLGTIVLLGYTVLRYHLVFISPVHEDRVCAPPGAHRLPEVQYGSGYLLESKSSESAYGIFLRELEKGCEGLIVTREHPEHVREKFRLAKTPIIWLTTHPGPGRIEPTNLSVLQHTISEFLRKGSRPVLLFEGLEYLMVNDKFDKVVQLCQMVRDEVMVQEGVLIIPVDAEAFTQREIALLERDLNVLSEQSVESCLEIEPAKGYTDRLPLGQVN
ncbi:MAG: hypothetical protein A4E32_01234 [Methanomassiliicoccales archaeon PtaU1.Bin124]|nr:MAG: hypothetical protein A4E32_01234 [Methanomassiliicoccales archaeon PtaU1.Bin124]